MPHARFAVLACACALASPAAAQAAVHDVSTPSQFEDAVASAQGGDTIRLANGTWPKLVVRKAAYDAPVVIAGSGDTTLTRLEFYESTNLVVEDAAVRPDGNDMGLVILYNTSHVTFENMTFDGISSDRGAKLHLHRSSSDIIIANSDFSHCPQGMPCLRLGADNTV